MKRISRKNRKIKRTRKDEIVFASLKVFCEKGYDGTSINDITKKIKCSHGLFYHYFSSKKEVFHEIMKIKHSATTDKIQKEISLTEDYNEKLKIIVDNIFYELKNDENFSYFFYFFVSEGFKKNSREASSIEKDKPTQKYLFRNFFKEGQEKGFFTTQHTSNNLARLFVSIISGATLTYIIAPKEIQKIIELPDTNMISQIFKKEKDNG